MASELRKTGLSVVGDVPWGTHFCCFYETKQDLLDILVPYFKAGLEGKEFCLWIISSSELISTEEAKAALGQAVSHLDRDLVEGRIEIVSHDQWFLRGGAFDIQRVANAFREKLDEALAKGYDGMRVNGSPAWLLSKKGGELLTFEEDLDQLFSHGPSIASCTYPLEITDARFLLDVARRHQFVVVRRQGNWELLETPELKQAKQEIKRLNQELEERVRERTRELGAVNDELRKEIAERRVAEEALKKEKEILEKIFANIPVMIGFVSEEGSVKLVNAEWERTIGWTLEELREQDVDLFAEAYPDPTYRQKVWDFVGAATGEWIDLKIKVRDGRVIDAACAIVQLSDGTKVAIAQDITERKQAEETLKKSETQLAEAQRLAHVGGFEWDLRSNVVTWSDELYQIFGVPPGSIQIRGDAMRFIHPEDRDLVLSTVGRAVANRAPYSFHYRVLRPDGDERIVHSRGQVVSDEDGVPIRVFGASQDVTELRRAEEKLKATSEQLRALSARLQSVKEEEGARIAREIHDELGSRLTSLKWDLEDLNKILSSPVGPSQLPTLGKKVEAMIDLTDATINTTRRISSELRPSVLDDLGLVAAIEWQTEQFQSRTGVVCRFESFSASDGLNHEQSTAVFRIFQEALTNVLRHARATRVDIGIREDDEEFILTVSDNGRGITEAEKSAPSSLGLLGMKERAYLVRGAIDIDRNEEGGTLITVQVPIGREAGF